MADMGDLLSAAVTALRAALSCPVESGFRSAAPTKLTVYVFPDSQTAEEPEAVSNITTEQLSLRCIVEGPDDDSQTAWDAVLGAVQTITETVAASRWLGDGWSGYRGQVEYGYVPRDGVQAPNLGADTTLEWFFAYVYD